MRACTVCGKCLPITSFFKHGYYADGSIEYKSMCKDCYRERGRQLRKNAIDRLRKYKTPCVKCGESRWYLIEFHHRDPSTKEFDITRRSYIALSKLEAEINKCDCLCKNCHGDFHFLNKECGISYDDYIASND